MTMKQLAMAVLIQVVAGAPFGKRRVCARAVKCSECL